jgi:hypothetical protein
VNNQRQGPVVGGFLKEGLHEEMEDDEEHESSAGPKPSRHTRGELRKKSGIFGFGARVRSGESAEEKRFVGQATGHGWAAYIDPVGVVQWPPPFIGCGWRGVLG